ncbi:MAG: SUMF1/EgtB/PvdO family nonheme iron enzyme [Nitrospinae bacterium]|nr:SUMF1/EgtB/PvdO family nonheme iron enzyme [Nitrospinota bacterium]
MGSGLALAQESDNGMVLIPAGEFWMGSPDGAGQKDENPRHKVYLDAYYIDRLETTGKDFEEYLAANPDQHPTITGWDGRHVVPDMARRPVFGLTWMRCRDYCSWRGKRLPTEAEWERAAAGPNNRPYPWGNEPPGPERANFGKCCFVMAGRIFAEVGSLTAGKTPEEGVYDLAGNAAEWVFDWYEKDYYRRSEYENPRGPEKGKYHVIRGGAWNSDANYMRSADRYGYDDAHDFYGVGCRCAKSVSGEAK